MLNIEKKPLIISGPCSAETEKQIIETCIALAKTGCVDMLRAGVWKPRTQPGMFEGVGVKALSWLDRAKQETGLPFAVEVATAKHVENALQFGADMLWIGARTSGNPFSVQEVADALKGVNIPVFIKNPMTPDVELWAGAIERIKNVGVKEIGLIHRGFSVYGKGEFRNNPMWSIAIEMKRRYSELPMLCDPSHICGNRTGLLSISQKSADLNYNGLIIESHISPEEAWSDASQQVTPERLSEIVKSISWREPSSEVEVYKQALEDLRSQIDQLDNEIFTLFSKRMEVATKIGEVKKANNVSILQANRWNDILEKARKKAIELKLTEDFMLKILDAIHVESINKQNDIMNNKR